MKMFKILSFLCFGILLMQSCGKQTPTEVSTDVLSEKIASDVDFQSMSRIDAEIFNKIEEIVTNSEAAEIDEQLKLENMASVFTQYEQELFGHLENLKNKYPEFATLEQEELEAIYQASNYAMTGEQGSIVNRSPCFTNSGDCQQDCHDCYRWLNQQDYANYRIRRDNCVANGWGDWNYCNTWSYNIYLQNHSSNYDWYLDCFYGC